MSYSAVAAGTLMRRSRSWLSHRRPLATSSSSQEPAAAAGAPGRIPWLLVSSPAKPESRFLYSPLLENITREVHLPQIAFHHFVGSSHGFLFSLNAAAEIHATNPLTGSHLPLPPTASLPGVAGVVCHPDQQDQISHYVLSVNKHSTPPQFRTFDVDSEMRYLYYSKAILSPSLDTAVVIHGGYSERDRTSAQLAFCRLGLGGERGWTALHSPFNSFHDVVFHKGRLHAVDYCGTIAVFDDLEGDPPAPPVLSPRVWLGSHPPGIRRSLVESPDGEDLFLVFRGLQTQEEWEKSRRNGYRGIWFCEEWGDESNPPRTKAFEVYKLDHSDYKWNRVDGIGDLALFLGYNHSLALSARDYPGLQPNSIYFTDAYVGYYKPEIVGDTGVCNLEDGSIRFYRLCFDGRQEFNWPPPIWYMPTITS